MISGDPCSVFGFSLQVVRKLNVWPFGVVLEESFKVFVDSRDVGPIILTHLYLLTGCTVPLWLGSPSTNMESKYTKTYFTEPRYFETTSF